jgi:hypothetical protein
MDLFDGNLDMNRERSVLLLVSCRLELGVVMQFGIRGPDCNPPAPPIVRADAYCPSALLVGTA